MHGFVSFKNTVALTCFMETNLSKNSAVNNLVFFLIAFARNDIRGCRSKPEGFLQTYIRSRICCVSTLPSGYQIDLQQVLDIDGLSESTNRKITIMRVSAIFIFLTLCAGFACIEAIPQGDIHHIFGGGRRFELDNL